MATHAALPLAIEAVEQSGWPAFFVRPDKRPYAGTHGHLDATDDPDTLRSLWRPGSLPALAVPSGRVVVDEDADGAADAAGLELPPTLEQRTLRGRHLFYVGDARPAVAVAPGIDLRGHGSYVVLYEPWWRDHRELATAPAWVASHRSGRSVDLASEEAEVFSEGERDSALTSAAGQMRAIGMTANEVYAALSVMNRERCRPPLDPSQVAKIARSSLSWQRGSVPRVRFGRRGGRGGR
jgi:putative DNA primase/helicase